jgi:hypothetical protein
LSTPDQDRTADLWIEEFGDAAIWHATKKLQELVEWGDSEGAAIWQHVIKIIEKRMLDAAAPVQGATVDPVHHIPFVRLVLKLLGRK